MKELLVDLRATEEGSLTLQPAEIRQRGQRITAHSADIMHCAQQLASADHGQSGVFGSLGGAIEDFCQEGSRILSAQSHAIENTAHSIEEFVTHVEQQDTVALPTATATRSGAPQT